MRRGLVAANWKMNGSRESITELLHGLRQSLDTGAGAQVLVCPPMPYLDLCSRLLQGSRISLGAQNAHEASSGAFTGETAPGMLLDFGVSHVILGHSERRQLFAETDVQVLAKCLAVQAQGMVPVLCVGETLQEREAGQAEAVVARQLDVVLEACELTKLVLAYEPVWAIGTGQTATPEQAQQMHAFIRQRVAVRSGAVAENICILYGGSVNADNAAQLFAQQDIDGGLVGGASLKPAEFIKICKSVSG
ncbi:MAG: triose-phosphate isomerase [Gammaproteobacteria bacterium]|nr:triose-phosphate isomerase [Pseudomonadales bacterium]MCP5329491.1 triose-phosphate isomerase [Pseudomonadales bacterium]